MASFIRSILATPSLCLRNHLNIIYAAPRYMSTAPTPKSLFDEDGPVDLSEDDEAVDGARPGTPPRHARTPPTSSTPTAWRAHRESIKERFPDGWAPPRKVSREAMHGLRQLHKLEPEKFTTVVLAEKFRISPEAVRRILKSKWEPSKERREKLVERERKARKETVRARISKQAQELEPLLAQKEAEELHLQELARIKSRRGRAAGPDRLTLT